MSTQKTKAAKLGAFQICHHESLPSSVKRNEGILSLELLVMVGVVGNGWSC